MSKQFDNTNRGALFKNNEKKSENSPEYTGLINIEGREFYLSGWVKEGKNGKFFSLSVKTKEQKPAEKPQVQPQRTPTRFEDDSIPF